MLIACVKLSLRLISSNKQHVQARSARDDAATLLEQLLTEERDENDALVQTARRLVEKTASTYDHVLQLQTKVSNLLYCLCAGSGWTC